MRRFLSLTSVCTVVVLAGIAGAQQINVAVGGSTLFSTKSNSASLAYPPPPERGGSYASVNAQIIFSNRFGFSAEVAARSKRDLYNSYQEYRPVLYDLNGVFAPRLPWRNGRMTADFMGGVGGQTSIFYNQFAVCGSSNAGNCPIFVNSNHFLLHLSGDVRYYFFRHFFVRPEAHYYYIVNNSEFHTGNVLRLGASVGYTFGPR